ncbi:hypothetical protein [Methylogaea oryzae]|uniref:Uncharacterized protein n=2 Tax=Methylogaea oryzae TaxID=1295382 RepID=A0A8D4VPG7_9GAMM|nr:hypothetical protein [Methylogaea oryzae]BBL70832.1 hypothetical protein MoryE10_14380 [Methylogaea oryzae]
MVVSTDAPLQGLSVKGPDGAAIPVSAVSRGGPPWSVSAVVEPGRNGGYRLEAVRNGAGVSCRTVQVGGAAQARPVDGWNRDAEAFYSAWIEQLFDAPLEENMSFPSLEPVLRNPERNFLHDHLAAGEDGKFPATPDCADLPYFLRTYFAWKIGLPVSFRRCSRGSANSPPRCEAPSKIDAFLHGPAPLGAFKAALVQVNNGVHSGSARTGLKDDATDLYPLPLKRDALWPGTVYADPYGHTLMIARWVPQIAGQSGLLLAVDAQPDNSVARKRFWEGTFLFADDVAGAGPGFKAFRPAPTARNADLADLPLRPYSDEQGEISREEFYARMGKLINPNGLDPRQAYSAMLDALVEQLNTRVVSVETGERYMQSHPGTVAEMPQGAAIFETIGPWEDYSTPSRDMRLIIAMNVLEALPEQIVRHPDLFVLNGRSPQEMKNEMTQLHAQRIQEREFTYTRSDGSPWPLSVAEVFARKAAFEMSYNPNDCAELRWGAQPGTPEYSTCRRHAPAAQKARMEQYRPWFRDAKRPSR